NLLNGQTILLLSGQLSITKDLDIEGPGAANLTVSGNNASRIFAVGAGTTSTIAGLTIADGRVVNSGGGGVVIESGATATLSHDTFANNTAYGTGGGLWNRSGGTVTVADSTFVGNQAIGYLGFLRPGISPAEGGGMKNDGTATVTNSAFINNL